MYFSKTKDFPSFFCVFGGVCKFTIGADLNGLDADFIFRRGVAALRSGRLSRCFCDLVNGIEAFVPVSLCKDSHLLGVVRHAAALQKCIVDFFCIFGNRLQLLFGGIVENDRIAHYKAGTAVGGHSAGEAV